MPKPGMKARFGVQFHLRSAWLLLALLVSWCQPTQANGSALHYALYRTWALSPPSASNPFKIVSYLPEGYLLEVVERSAIVVSGEPYSLVVTQDAAELLVHDRAISEWPFHRAVGDHDLVFHREEKLCLVPDCLRVSDRLTRRGVMPTPWARSVMAGRSWWVEGTAG